MGLPGYATYFTKPKVTTTTTTTTVSPTTTTTPTASQPVASAITTLTNNVTAARRNNALSTIQNVHNNNMRTGQTVNASGKYTDITDWDKYARTSDQPTYDVDSALNDIYNQAKERGITIARPKKYGNSITDQRQAQKIVDEYLNAANSAISKNASKSQSNTPSKQSSTAKKGGSANTPRVTNTQTAPAPVKRGYLDGVTPGQKIWIDNWNRNEQERGVNDAINPDWVIWRNEKLPGPEPAKYWKDAPASNNLARDVSRANRDAEFAESQRQLQASYDATQKAAGTTHAKNTKAVTNNGKSASQIAATNVKVKPTTKATVVKAGAKVPSVSVKAKQVKSEPTTASKQTTQDLMKINAKLKQTVKASIIPRGAENKVKLKDGTWIDKIQTTGANNPNSGRTSLFTESSKDYYANAVKASQKAYDAYQSQRANFKESVDKSGNVIAAIQSKGNIGTGMRDVRIIQTDKNKKITSMSASRKEYTQAIAQQNKIKEELANKTSTEIHDKEYDRELARNAELQKSSNPLIREWAKLDRKVSDYTMGLATNAMTGAHLVVGNKVSDADMKHLEKTAGVGTAKTYSKFVNGISTKYGNATLFNEKSVNSVANGLKTLEHYAVIGIVNTTPNVIRDNVGKVSNNLKSNKYSTFAGNVVRSVEKSDEILPGIIVAGNRIPSVAVSALKESEYLSKNKSAILPAVAYGAGAMVAGTVKSAYDDPVETAAYFVAQDAALKGVVSAAKVTTKVTGLGTGLTRGSLHIVESVKNGDIIPLKTKGSIVETLLTQEKVSGARAVDVPTSKTVLVRKPIAPGEEHATLESAFMTLKTGDVNTVSDYFFHKNNKSIIKQRVFELDDIQTAKLPTELKTSIRQSIKDTGQFKTQYKEVESLAQLQADKTGQPVAIPSPKTAIGYIEQENEVSLVFPRNAQRSQIKLKGGETASLYKVNKSSFAGFTRNGVIVKKLSFGNTKPTTAIQNIKANLKHNYDVGIDKYGMFNKADQRAVTLNALQREQELYEGALHFKGSYDSGKHGVEHTENVISNIKGLNKKHGIGANEEYIKTLGKYHDITKIGAHDIVYGGEHAVSGARAIRSGELKGLKGLSQKELDKIADDIAKHTKIKPVALKSPVRTTKLVEVVKREVKQDGKDVKVIPEHLKLHNPLHLQNPLTGLKTKIVTRPSTEAKLLATADRMDLTRFGMKVDEKQIFKFGDDTARARLTKSLDSFESQVARSKLMRDTTAEFMPRRRVLKDSRITNEHVTSRSGYNSIKETGYTVSSYARSLKAQESMYGAYKSGYAGKSAYGYKLPGKSGSYYAGNGKSSTYYPTTKTKSYTPKGTYEKTVAGSKYKPANNKRYTVTGNEYTPRGSKYNPSKGEYSTYTPKKGEYTPIGGYKPESGYNPTGGYSSTGVYSSIPSGGYGGSGGSSGGYGGLVGGEKANIAFFNTKKRKGYDVIAKKKKKNQNYIKKVDDLAKKKRTIYNKLGGLESMFGSSSKPVKKTHKRKTTAKRVRA